MLGLVEDEWEPLLTLDDRHPSGSVTVLDHGSVALDLRVILDD